MREKKCIDLKCPHCKKYHSVQIRTLNIKISEKRKIMKLYNYTDKDFRACFVDSNGSTYLPSIDNIKTVEDLPKQKYGDFLVVEDKIDKENRESDEPREDLISIEALHFDGDGIIDDYNDDMVYSNQAVIHLLEIFG
jgi:hypothetical protein